MIDWFRAGEPEPVGARCFGSLKPEPEPLEKKKPGAGAAWKKSQEPGPLKKQPAPQPCEKIKSKGNCTLVTLL